MSDSFFLRALIAGIGIALMAGPLGCVIVWKRMAYFGDTLAHSALLGIALSLFFNIGLTVGVLATVVLMAVILFYYQNRQQLPSDTVLGILAHSSLALGLVLVSLMPGVRVDLMAYLLGDILSVSNTDLLVIYGGGIGVLLALAMIWRSLVASIVSEDIASAEGLAPARTRLIFTIMIAVAIAISMKMIGILLITSLLIIPAATARQFSKSPEVMIILAAIFGVLAVVTGLYGSLVFDPPSGPSIVVAALLVFIISHVLAALARAVMAKEQS